jgi:hypothetical protein
VDSGTELGDMAARYWSESGVVSALKPSFKDLKWTTLMSVWFSVGHMQLGWSEGSYRGAALQGMELLGLMPYGQLGGVQDLSAKWLYCRLLG